MRKFTVVNRLVALAVVAGALFVSASSANAQSGGGFGHVSNSSYGNYFHPTYSNHVNHHGAGVSGGYLTYQPRVSNYGTVGSYCGNSTGFAPSAYTRNYGGGKRFIFRRW